MFSEVPGVFTVGLMLQLKGLIILYIQLVQNRQLVTKSQKVACSSFCHNEVSAQQVHHQRIRSDPNIVIEAQSLVIQQAQCRYYH